MYLNPRYITEALVFYMLDYYSGFKGEFQIKFTVIKICVRFASIKITVLFWVKSQSLKELTGIRNKRASNDMAANMEGMLEKVGSLLINV